MNIEMIPLNKITPDPNQPRKFFRPETLQELAKSIRATGVQQPIHVRWSEELGCYIIIAGERRWRASGIAERVEIPAIVLSFNTDALVFQIVENVQREALNPIEEALGYWRLMDEKKLIQAQIAQLVGKSDFHIANRLSLLKLPDELKNAIATGKLSVGSGILIVSRCKTHEEMMESISSLKNRLSAQGKGMSGITATSLAHYFDRRDRQRVAVKKMAVMRVSPEEKALAEELLAHQGAFLESFTRMVGVAESSESADYCVRLWLSLSEGQQRVFARALQMISDHTKTFTNHIMGRKNLIARRRPAEL